MSRTWNKIDETSLPQVRHLRPDDDCWYAKDFVAGTGYQGGAVNSDIVNFKKSPGAQGQYYREQAISKFALEASELFKCDDGIKYTVTAIPSSKMKIDPLYDHRFEDFFNELKRFAPCIDVVWPVVESKGQSPSHQGGTRNPNDLMNGYSYNGFPSGVPKLLFVFDDVLTTGAHFRAFKDFIIQQGFQGKVCGIFWAKARNSI